MPRRHRVIESVWQDNEVHQCMFPFYNIQKRDLFRHRQCYGPLVKIIVDFFDWWTGKANIAGNIYPCQILICNGLG